MSKADGEDKRSEDEDHGHFSGEKNIFGDNMRKSLYKNVKKLGFLG